MSRTFLVLTNGGSNNSTDFSCCVIADVKPKRTTWWQPQMLWMLKWGSCWTRPNQQWEISKTQNQFRMQLMSQGVKSWKARECDINFSKLLLDSKAKQSKADRHHTHGHPPDLHKACSASDRERDGGWLHGEDFMSLFIDSQAQLLCFV